MSSRISVAVRDVTFRYQSAPDPTISALTADFPRGFTGIIGANGSGKTTLLQLVAGLLAPESGTIHGAGDAIYCEQRTDNPPAGFVDFLNDWDSEGVELRRRLGIEFEYLEHWDTLSHGERKRAQIAHALWCRPEVFTIDEPTNHIDAGARNMLVQNLKCFQGIGLIVSHDRDLLDDLCDQCLWLEPPTSCMYPGGYTQALQQKELGRDVAIRERQKAVNEHKRLQREVFRRRDKAARSNAERSKRGLGPKDSDGREKINLARVSGKDGQAGRLLRQLDGRVQQADVRAKGAVVTKQYETGIWLPGSRSQRDMLFELSAGEVPLAPGRVLRFPQLLMKPEDRIAITGLNGLGKSTLIRLILNEVNVPPEKIIEMPQEVSLSKSRQILEMARTLSNEKLGHVMNVVSRLGSRPHRLLESIQPSPGEIRKLLLALGMARSPHLIVMDEPTNHLDPVSVEALETVLADCPCGLLVVSHDQRFLERVSATSWRIKQEKTTDSIVIV